MNLIAEELIKKHEGLMLKVYICPSGYNTIGYGRNLDTKGISKSEADLLLVNDVKQWEKELTEQLDIFSKLSEIRQAALIDMAHNLGIEGLLGFKKMIGFARQGEFGKAAVEILSSKYGIQVPKRAVEIARMFQSGVIQV